MTSKNHNHSRLISNEWQRSVQSMSEHTLNIKPLGDYVDFILFQNIMNVNRLWKQRIERDLNAPMIDEDFVKLLREYDTNSKITRKRAREISRKLIGVYPDQVMSWFNYKTWLSLKYLPKSNTVKDSYKIDNQTESYNETSNHVVLQLYSVFYHNIINQSYQARMTPSDESSTISLQSPPIESTCENLILLADVADSMMFDK